MKRSYFGNAVLYELQKQEWTQLRLADESGIAQSSLSQIIAQPKRPEADTLRALCTCWPDSESNLRVLIEHLRDEMVRAGHKGEGELEFRPAQPRQADLDRDLALISDTAALDSDLAALLHDLATLLRRARGKKTQQGA